MDNTFTYCHTITMGETNPMANVYFAEYFKLQGIVREHWLIEEVENALEHIKNGLILSTISAHCDYIKPFFLYDTIICILSVEDIKKVSVKLVFDFYSKNTNSLHATGYQKIVFQDAHRKICPIPLPFKTALQRFVKAEEVSNLT
jgi:enediyne core biosynthesis thioesterase